eukprot:m.148942 g.148942  ORF g.148942 m.148942 type:complete len:454 (+) comp52755_c0_seq1:285-1646(+)
MASMALIIDCEAHPEPSWLWTNWAQTKSCRPARLFEPRHEDDIREILAAARASRAQVRVTGTGHSPSDIACTSAWMVSLRRMNALLTVDGVLATFEAGATIEHLNEELAKHNLAFPSLGSISEQAAAGACATATHGSGINFGTSSSSIVALRLMTYDGQVIVASEKENRDVFEAARCSVGALGIITQLTMVFEPSFDLRMVEYEISFARMLSDWEDIVHRNEHMRFMWYPHTDTVVVAELNRTRQPRQIPSSSWFRDVLVGYHALEFLLYLSRFCQPLVPLISKAWVKLFHSTTPKLIKIDRSDRVFNINCLFRQYVDEWAIDVKDFPEAMRQLRAWIDKNAHVHFPVEVRFVKEDSSWLSPAYQRNSCYIGVIMYRPYGKPVPYRQYFQAYERIMQGFRGRPHWAKVFSCDRSYLQSVYPQWSAFEEVRARLDPVGGFANDWQRRVFGLNTT